MSVVIKTCDWRLGDWTGKHMRSKTPERMQMGWDSSEKSDQFLLVGVKKNRINRQKVNWKPDHKGLCMPGHSIWNLFCRQWGIVEDFRALQWPESSITDWKVHWCEFCCLKPWIGFIHLRQRQCLKGAFWKSLVLKSWISSILREFRICKLFVHLLWK